MKRRNKQTDIIQLVLSIVILVFLNIISSYKFHRFDLTSEKRYTLSDATKKLLRNLNDVVYVKVYLEGEFPAGFKRLRNETKIMLDEFRAYSKGNMEYEFINPSENPDKNQQQQIYRQLYQKGLKPTNLEVKEESGKSEQIIFPAALVSYGGKETPWQLFNAQAGVHPDVVLNNAVQALEYGFANALRNLQMDIKPAIAFLDGHGELDSLRVMDITRTLKEYYEVSRVVLNENLNALTERDSNMVRNKYKAIIIAKPDSGFTKKDQFIIDQYIMHGGKVVWLLDMVYTNLDSLSRGFTIGLPNDMNLDEMLFKYGVRINKNLIQDMQASYILVNKALMGNQPRWEVEPWLFNPLISPLNIHPIVNNLDLIKFEFASSIDTIKNKNVKKTILLTTSKYARVVNTPARIALAMVNMKPDERMFHDSYMPVAVLLEGEFESLFKNRMDTLISKNKQIGFRDQSDSTKMIVVSDGDVIKNIVQKSTGKFFPLGYDMTTEQTYGNKNFLLNCIDYLCDDSGLLSIRAKEVKLRLLDKKKIKTLRVKWQLINIIVPVLLVIVLGVILFYIRKKKYSTILN